MFTMKNQGKSHENPPQILQILPKSSHDVPPSFLPRPSTGAPHGAGGAAPRRVRRQRQQHGLRGLGAETEGSQGEDLGKQETAHAQGRNGIGMVGICWNGSIWEHLGCSYFFLKELLDLSLEGLQ